MNTQENKPVTVYSRDGAKKGISTTGMGYRCRMAGCTGRRLSIKWEDGKVTRPCTKGMMARPDGDLQIG